MVLRSILATTAVAGVLVGGLVAGATAADAAPSGSSQGNCPDASPVPGKSDSLLVEAPAGQVITGYCVKSAGLKGTTGAPETVVLATPVSSLVLRHTEGGNLTHYTLFTAPVATEPEEPTDPEQPPVGPTDPEEPIDPETPEEPVEEPESTPNPPVTTPGGGFDWDWTYETPGCDGLVVAYPSNIPTGQSNDVNIRLMTDQGEITLNYHLDQGTWSGTTAFVYSQHRLWPANVTSYAVVWTQVGGTNYHWQGAVECALGEPSPTTGARNGYAVVKPGTGGTGTVPGEPAADLVAGYRTGTTTLSRGQRLGADTIVVTGLEGRTLELQRLRKGAWSTVGTVATADGTATVTYPKQAKRGSVGYRLVAGDWTSEVLTVRVR
ncbi:MAG: hypothetical protein ACO1ON_01870 [Nocardioides sp.]